MAAFEPRRVGVIDEFHHGFINALHRLWRYRRRRDDSMSAATMSGRSRGFAEVATHVGHFARRRSREGFESPSIAPLGYQLFQHQFTKSFII